MKKYLSFLLIITILCMTCIVAFADTEGEQDVSLDVPETTILPSAAAFIERPVHGGSVASSVDDFTLPNDVHYSIASVSVSSEGSTYVGGETVTWTINCLPDVGYRFGYSSSFLLTDMNETTLGIGTVSQTEGDICGFSVSYEVPEFVPTWTLTIPSDVSIEYGSLSANLGAPSVGMSNDASTPMNGTISCYIQHAGALSDGSGHSIPFTVILDDQLTLVPANTRTECCTVPITNSQISGADMHSAILTFAESALRSATPGHYTTTVTYSSSFSE